MSKMMYGFTREFFRNLARERNVPRGQNTKDTIKNLLKAEEIRLVTSVAVMPMKKETK